MGSVQGRLRPWRRCGGLRETALDSVRRCDPPVYLSNAEKEALQLTGYGDPPPWAVVQGLEQALAKGAYIPGEEALRLRLTAALDLEERLALQQADELQESADVAIGDLAFAAACNEMASHVAEGFQQGLVEGVEASQEAAATEEAAGQEAFEEALVDAIAAGDEPAVDWEIDEATTDGQEAAEEPPTDQWRSPLEIVTEGAEEAEREAAAVLMAAFPHLCNTCAKDFPHCDGTNIVWGSDIDPLAKGADADIVVSCREHEPKPAAEAPGGEDAAPAAVAQRIEDRDFSSFTKAQLLAFAQDHFGAKLSRADSKDDLIGQVQGLVDEANEKTV